MDELSLAELDDEVVVVEDDDATVIGVAVVALFR